MTGHNAKENYVVGNIIKFPERVIEYWEISQIMPQDVPMRRKKADSVMLVIIPYASGILNEYIPHESGILRAELLDSEDLPYIFHSWVGHKDKIDLGITKGGH